MDTSFLEKQNSQAQIQGSYRGRVRTGCLTCRARKVKCDEQRPICNNCTRLQRQCVFKLTRGSEKKRHEASQTSNSTSLDSSLFPANSQSPGSVSEVNSDFNTVARSHEQLTPPQELALFHRTDGQPNELRALVSVLDRSPMATHESEYTILRNELKDSSSISLMHNINMASQESTTALSAMSISQGIQLTTTIDFLAAGELPAVSSFSYFVESVDCPYIMPYDHQNWRWMKTHAAKLGTYNKAVAAGFLAIQALYKAQLHGLSTQNAVTVYGLAKRTLEEILEGDDSTDFDTILVATFLLCIFEVSLPYETASIVKLPTERFLQKMAAWSSQEQLHQPLSLRIIAWLKLLHATAIRGGGPGLFSDSVTSLFPSKGQQVPNLDTIALGNVPASGSLYGFLSNPVFNFYTEIQEISSKLAMQTHYHRSRATNTDQEEVVQIVGQFKSQIYTIWEGRPSPMRMEPRDLRDQLSPEIADPLIKLVGICTAACFAEILEIDRVLGYPQLSSTESKQAMHRVRQTVDGDWNAVNQDGNLSPGYLRPLFLYAIETTDRGETDWAVQRLRQIRNAICRSDFFASFAQALTDAQYSTGRRVTSKYFCFKEFGVWPPFM